MLRLQEVKTVLGYWRRALWRVDWWFCFFMLGIAPIEFHSRPSAYLLVLCEGIDSYGETPWKTFVELLQWVEWRTEDHFVELGSGTSRLSILLGVCGAKSCTAVELIPLICLACALDCRALCSGQCEHSPSGYA